MTNSPPAQVKEWVAVVRIAKCSGDRRPITVSASAVLYAHEQMEASLKAMRRAVLALAFAAETSAAMRDDYDALDAAIKQATKYREAA